MDIQLDVLVPTCDRPTALAVTLAGLTAQSVRPLRVVVSDQSAHPVMEVPEVRSVIRVLRARGHAVEAHRHVPRRGMAEQRAFLLSQANAPYCVFLDDDVLTEPDLFGRMLRAIRQHGCGFVGSAVHGLSHADSVRPQQQHIEFWPGQVEPETVVPDSAAWNRHHLHSAANLFHVQQKLMQQHSQYTGWHQDMDRAYRVAWVGGCVLFDTGKLRESGGFEFWTELPPDHCGEDVLAQLRVMARYGGCGLFPSGAYHLELPTTVRAREHDAPRMLWHGKKEQTG
ncbi:MAG: glycosyltransferase family 2 protein [Gammaproteobacteria bacterium]